MNCDVWQDKIDAFVDSELTPAQMDGFEQHLRDCPACSAETVSRQRLKLETRLAARRYTPSTEFESRIRRSIAAPRARWNWIPTLATAASLIIVAFVVGWFSRQSLLQRQVVSQFVDQHVATMASASPFDVVSADSHTVKPWFTGKVPFRVDIPELAGTPYTLLGGRLTYVQQAPAAHLIFSVRKHRISVFMFREGPDTAALGLESSPVRRLGFSTQTWLEDGIRYFVISDVNPSDVHNLCELLKRTS
jgi:anti-sigma factor RsiW